jgi:hypothetical protein
MGSAAVVGDVCTFYRTH